MEPCEDDDDDAFTDRHFLNLHGRVKGRRRGRGRAKVKHWNMNGCLWSHSSNSSSAPLLMFSPSLFTSSSAKRPPSLPPWGGVHAH